MSSQLNADLREVRRLLAHPTNWVRGHYIQKIDNDFCYCLDGAAMKATGATPYPDRWVLDLTLMDKKRYDNLVVVLRANTPGHSIWDFNDFKAQNHNEILAFLDRVIEATP